MRVWAVRFYVLGEETLELFTEEWRAKAFLAGCTPTMRATLHELVEASK